MKRILPALFLLLALGGCSIPPGWNEFVDNSEEHTLITARLEEIRPYLGMAEYQIEADELLHRRIALEAAMKAYIEESGLWKEYDEDQRRGVLKAFSARLAQAKDKLHRNGSIETPFIRTWGS